MSQLQTIVPVVRMWTLVHVIAYLALGLVTKNEAAKILAVFPTPSVSHQVVFRPLTQELARRGHEVIVVTTDPAFPKGQTPANLTEVDVHDLSYKMWKEQFFAMATGNAKDLNKQVQVILELFPFLFEKQVQSKGVQEILNKGHDYFDLLLLEACFRPALSLTHVFKAPVIQISSFGRIFGNYETIGAPVHPILYPLATQQRIYNVTFWEKITELYNYYWLTRLFDSLEQKENEVIRRIFGSDVPTLSALSNNVDMMFVNIHPIFEGNHPVPPGVIHVWGLHQIPEKKLPEDLKSYLDMSKNGVIYMSFGTNTDPSMLPPEKIQMFVRVFSELPYNILWKWNKDELPGRTNNIRIEKWFPQSDLLKHPNIKLFITQGGLQSTDEAIAAGVPLVGIPMLGDQWYNTEKYVYHKIGVKLNLETLNEQEFRSAIQSVINDKSYRHNMIKLRSLFMDQPQPPLERAVWWTEYVLRHGGARHLRSPAANITWAEYLELELVLILFVGFLVTLFCLVTSLLYLYKYISSYFVTSVKIKMK